MLSRVSADARRARPVETRSVSVDGEVRRMLPGTRERAPVAAESRRSRPETEPRTGSVVSELRRAVPPPTTPGA